LFGDDNFLLVTSDHIHSHELIKEVANTNLQTPEISAAVLVDESDSSKRLIDVLHSNDGVSQERNLLPKTAVLVRTLSGTGEHASAHHYPPSSTVLQIGRAPLEGAHAVEAGLMACDKSIFAALQEIADKGRYFALCEAMQLLASRNRLCSVATKGRAWFAIETTAQLEQVKNFDHDPSDAMLPWQVLVAATPHTVVVEGPLSPPSSIPTLQNASSFLCSSNANPIQILPSDIEDIAILTRTESFAVPGSTSKGNTEEVVSVKLVVSRKVPLIGWVMLVNAGIASSTLGTAFDLLPGVDPLLKNMWRTSVLLLLLIPLNMYNHRSTSVVQWMKDNLTPHLVRHLVQFLVGYFYMTVVFAQALERTSAGHTYLFGGCTSVALVLIRFFSGEKVAAVTMMSVLLAMSGAAVCLGGGTTNSGNDPSPADILDDVAAAPIQESPPSMFGDMLAFTVSIAGVFFYNSTKELRKKNWDVLTIYLVQQLFLVVVFAVLLGNGVLVGTPPTWDMDPITGYFGWMTQRNLPVLIFIALYCDLLGVVGYMAVMKYFDPLVITIMTLMEPLISIVIGCALGMAPFPSLGTWIGGAMMIAGAFGVSPTGHSKETVDASGAIMSSPCPSAGPLKHTNAKAKYGTFERPADANADPAMNMSDENTSNQIQILVQTCTTTP
jgi:drug/metabolite transporter (DMT)-like permease